MKLTDTLDQILRTLLATDGSSGGGPSTETATGRPTLADDLEAGVAARLEASERAAGSAPPRSSELARLEATVGVVEKLGLGFHLGSAVERIAAAATEGSAGGRKL